jgi:hypothetical protein
MSQFGRIEVADREGWRREHPLQKNIIHVGSDARNDIVLDTSHGSGVSPRHLQLIALDGQGFRMVNIGSTDVSIGAVGERTIAPLGVLDIGSGERIKVGDFLLTLYAGPGGGGGGSPAVTATGISTAGGGGERNSGSIGLSVSFPNISLSPTRPIDGVVNVRNLGDKTGAQFRIEIEGLDPEFYEIGPGPILFPGAEKSVSMRIHHPRKADPPAGELRLRIRATAPTAYPGDSAQVTQTIRILPYHTYKLRLVIPE